MRRLTTGTFVVAIALLSFGCASRALTENQCVAGDWETVGFRDGSAGVASSALLRYQDACGKFGIIPHRELYMAGWRDGVRQYCRADNGFALGENGRSHSDLCPEDLRLDFVAAYDRGRELYLARSDVANLETTLAKHRARLDTIETDMLALAADQIDPVLTAEERADIFVTIKARMDERKRIEAEIPALEADLATAVAHLDHVQQTLAYRD